DHEGALAPIYKIISSEPVLTPEMILYIGAKAPS
ncbi:MAG: hypothetical protein K0S98_2114, partial [Propionibacteriaceae bacterium]|nr:hypothetical protein [Propionibacteriaceae bacterium]